MEEDHQEQIDTQDSIILGLPDAEIVGVDVICRLCANQSDRIIGIYSEEGITNNLANKMNLYLPIKVSEADNLPLQCCWACASTVLAWHELVLASVEADRRLRNELIVTTVDSECNLKELQGPETSLDGLHYGVENPDNSSDHDENEADPDNGDTSLSAFCQGSSVDKQSFENENLDKIWSKEKDPLEYMEDLGGPFIEMSECHSKQDMTLEQFEDLKTEDAVKVKKKPATKRKTTKKTENLLKSESDFSDNPLDMKLYEVLTIKEENQPDQLNYVCHYCSLVYENENDIINHLKTDHTDKVVSVENSEKGDVKNKFAQRKRYTKVDQDAINAAKIEVEGRVYYNCKSCGKSLHSPYTYLWHMRIHTGERPFVCDLCGKQFRVSQGLVRHLRETHEGVKNYPCDLCGRMFSSRRNVEEHRRIHTNERPYICDLCGKSFKQKASLFVHNRSHTSTYPYRCSYCNQGFRSRGPLLLHVTKHTGEKPYPCDVCGRCFRIKYELKRHQLIHSDSKPFVCSECGLSFRQKRYLKNHKKINHNSADN